MTFFRLLFGFALALIFICPVRSEAWRGRHWYGQGFNLRVWQGGYWYHGYYMDRNGWWWIVGPTWYFYNAPVYPYPPSDVAPSYYVQVSGPPPPPGAVISTPQTLTPPPANAVALPQPPPPKTLSPSMVQTDTVPTTATPTKNNQAFSYYCENTKSYYPNVKTCDAGWIATPVNPPK